MLPYWSRPNVAWDSTHMVYADTPNFTWMCSVCRLSVPKITILSKFWHLQDSCTDFSFTDEGQIWCGRADQRSTFTAKFCLDRFILWPCANPKFYHFIEFGFLWRSQLAAIWESWVWVHNHKPSPIQRVKIFLYSKAFITKSGAQSLTFKRVTGRQTNGQKNSAGEVQAPPNN